MLVQSTPYPKTAAFAPSSLFSAGEYGFAIDPSDLTKVWQQIDGTVAGASGQPVGRIDDISGNARHFAAAANDTTRPTLQSDGTLLFDGVNDAIKHDDAGLYAAGAATVVCRVRAPSQRNTWVFAETQTTSDNAGYVPGTAPHDQASNTDTRVFIRNNARVIQANSPVGLVVYNSVLHTLIAEDTGSQIAVTCDGVAGTPVSYPRTTAVTLNQASLGAYWANNPTAHPIFSGNIGRFIAIGRLLTSAEKTNALNWVAGL